MLFKRRSKAVLKALKLTNEHGNMLRLLTHEHHRNSAIVCKVINNLGYPRKCVPLPMVW